MQITAETQPGSAWGTSLADQQCPSSGTTEPGRQGSGLRVASVAGVGEGELIISNQTTAVQVERLNAFAQQPLAADARLKSSQNSNRFTRFTCGSAFTLAMTSSGTGSSTATMQIASPPGLSRPRLSVAMLSPACPISVPNLPMNPGLS